VFDCLGKSRRTFSGLYKSKSTEVMGDKYKRKIKVHGPILIDHYYSFRLNNDEFQSLIRTKELLEISEKLRFVN